MTQQIPLFKVFMNPDINITSVLTSGMITQGAQVEKFEQELNKWFDHPYILTLNAATSGLTLAVRLANLGPDDEILSTPLTCFATNASILANIKQNQKIKWVDIDPKTCNIDLNDLERKITDKTKVIMFVHWGGSPLDLDVLEEIKSKAELKYGHKIYVIEDCAHAFGAEYNGKFVGTHGNICVFSTQAIKHLTTGDGGLIFLPNEELYERAKLLRWYGISREQRNAGGKDFRLEPDIAEWGYKFHMNDINASIGLSNLPFIKKNLEIIRENCEYYNNELKNTEGVELLDINPKAKSAYWIYTIKIINKLDFIQFMKDNGVMVSQVHNRNDKNSCLKDYICDLPSLDKLSNKIISIPCGWWVTKEQREKIAELIKTWCKKQVLPISKLEYSDIDKYSELLCQLTNYKKEYTEEEKHIRFDNLTKNALVLVIKDENDNIVASGKVFIEYKLHQSVGHIEDIVVDKNNRHRGYASRIVMNLVNYAKSIDCYKIILAAKPELESLYSSCGFKNEGYHFVVRCK